MHHGSEHEHFTSRLVSRRQLLQIGGLGCLGSGLAGLFDSPTSQAATARRGSPAEPIRSCILIYFYGGPSHLDTWDLKPQAPAEVRGTFGSIATRVPGVHVCEHLPHCAGVMDRLAVVRSMHHPMRNHNAAAVESLCGRTPLKGDLELLADETNSPPCYGALVSRMSPRRRDRPNHIALPHVMSNVVMLPGQTAGFLGAAYNPFQVNHDPNDPNFRVNELGLPVDLSMARLEDRYGLVAAIDAEERRAAQGPMTVYRERALDLIRSQPLRRAFDLSQESPALRER
jgi:hypothetical protein